MKRIFVNWGATSRHNFLVNGVEFLGVEGVAVRYRRRRFPSLRGNFEVSIKKKRSAVRPIFLCYEKGFISPLFL